MEGHERLLTVIEVAAMFRVDPKTIRRWVYEGKLVSHRTPGGHHRFFESEVRAMNARPGIVPAPPPGAGPGPEHG